MPRPNPGQTSPKSDALPTQAQALVQRIWRAVWPLLVVGASSYLLYRASPLVLLAGATAALGWLQWGTAQTLLDRTHPTWLPQALVAGMLLIYLMQIVYGWREEMGYWASLWHLFGWIFITNLFWAFVLAWVVRWLFKVTD